jgi:catechol 2,3-dioxygenase-like lactoylglutathione lyase family enzyme
VGVDEGRSTADMGRSGSLNTEFELGGINHLALVCRDMQRTVDFYGGVLGMPLVKTIELPFGMGQHFFFDIGNGDSLAFFWVPDAPEPAPGVASPRSLPSDGELVTAIGSMNHVAFDVAPEKIDEYLGRLREKGVEAADVMNHDDSELGVSKDIHEGTFVRSIYFFDPDGILLEFAAWTRELGDGDVRHRPAIAAQRIGTGTAP